MSGSHEIELKFLCAPDDLSKVLAAAPQGEDETRELRSVYFDTPDLKLQKKGVSLRIRESKGRRVQTLKRGEGLAREEHEHPVEHDEPDMRLGPLAEILPDGGAALRPAFDVRVTRRQRLLRHGGAKIELAVDEGQVEASGATARISEVELELKSGRPKALFDLARELNRAAPLYLSFDSKAARGQALAAGAPLQARRKERVELPADATAAQAFRATARNALGQIAANAVVMRDTGQPDATHQLRVAARRLRSAIATFGPLLSETEAEHIKAELRWLAHACDAARNLDVLAERVAEARARDPSAAGLAALAEVVEQARRAATEAAVAAVRSDRFRLLMIDATAWIETGAWLADDAGRDVRDQKATAFAAAALDRRRRKLRKLARRLDEVSDEARHEARIEAKKLRYAAETFASLFPEKATARFIGRLKDLQEELGALNDTATAEPVLAGLDLTPEAAAAARELLARQSKDRAAHIRRAVRAFESLEDAPRFWR